MMKHQATGPCRPQGKLHRIAGDTQGVAAIEFALIMPIFLTLMVGLLDVGQSVYATAILNGAVEQAARSSSLETADTVAADQIVEEIVGPILPGMTMTTTRMSYFDFTDIDRPERWNDVDGNGSCDNGESFTDENRSGSWDADVGSSGNGGAGDVVFYTVTVTYRTAFPIPALPDTWSERTLSSTAVRKNQPFATQTTLASTAGVCA